MISKQSLLWLFIFFSLLCQGQSSETLEIDQDSNQTKKHQFSIGFSLGFSFAFGKFSEFYENYNQSAFAKKNGSSFHLFDINYQIKEAFHAKAYYLKASHKVSEQKFASTFNSNQVGYQLTSSGTFDINAFIGGLGFSKVGESLSFDFYFLLGYGNTITPSFTFLQSNSASNTQREIQFRPEKVGGLCFGVNPSIKIHLNPILDFTTQATYLVFDQEINRVNPSPQQLDGINSYNIEILTLTFGFAYRI